MIRIAIVDDDRNICNLIEQYLRDLSQQMMFRSTIDVFYDGESFCKYLTDHEKFDLIFLDIELKHLSGVTVGKYIREELNDLWTQIIYISIRKDYAMDLFQNRPLDFLVKPLDKEKIRHNLSVYLDLFPKNDIFSWKQGRETHQLSYHSILYFSSENKEVVLCSEQGISSFYGKLSNIENDLPSYFWRIHRSHIVNRNYITHHFSDRVKLKNGAWFPISKQYRSIIRKKLMEIHSIGGEDLFP